MVVDEIATMAEDINIHMGDLEDMIQAEMSHRLLNGIRLRGC